MQEESNEENELDPSLIIEDTPEEEPQDQSASPNTSEPEEEIPDKYRGKSAMDVVRMHQDAERLIGKQGNEVGELRKMVDDILASNATTSNPAPEEPEPDFFEDPKAATSRAISEALANEPRLEALGRFNQGQEQSNAATALTTRHPDAKAIINDPTFGEWISKSKVRTKMFTEANKSFDHETASEIIDLWKERKDYASEAQQNGSAQRANTVRKASTGSGKASSETRGKPFLSRDALVELKRTNPDKYYSMMPQIKLAYIEKRVR